MQGIMSWHLISMVKLTRGYAALESRVMPKIYTSRDLWQPPVRLSALLHSTGLQYANRLVLFDDVRCIDETASQSLY